MAAAFVVSLETTAFAVSDELSAAVAPLGAEHAESSNTNAVSQQRTILYFFIFTSRQL